MEQEQKKNYNQQKRKSTFCVMDRASRKVSQVSNQTGLGSQPPQKTAGSGIKMGNLANYSEPVDKEKFRSVFNRSVPISEGSETREQEIVEGCQSPSTEFEPLISSNGQPVHNDDRYHKYLSPQKH